MPPSASFKSQSLAGHTLEQTSVKTGASGTARARRSDRAPDFSDPWAKGDARSRPCEAVRLADPATERASETKPDALPRGFHVSTYSRGSERAARFKIAKCDLKAGAAYQVRAFRLY